MSLSSLRTKWLSGIMAAFLLLTIFAPVSMADESQQSQTNGAGSTEASTPLDPDHAQQYSDVPDQAWFAEAVNDWIARGILSPQPGDKFKPQFVATRGDFAFLLAYSLGLTPSENSGVFKDLPDSDLAGYIVALQEAGLAHGYLDGTFRPNQQVTRAEAASWIAAAKKMAPQTGSAYRDVPPTSWYSGAVGALASAGLVSGKSKDRFAPGDVITRAETINLLYRSFYKSSIIQDIQDDGTIMIDGHAYRAGDSVTGIFQPSNLAVLRNAAIQFTPNGDTIVSVENLHIGYKEALDGQYESLVFNAEGDTINGVLIVNADRLSLANVEVKGDLLLTSAIQTNFFGYDVLVKGKAVYLADTGRPKSQVADLEFQRSDLGKLVLEKSANVKQVQVVPESVSYSGSNSKNEVRVSTNFGALYCQNNCSVVNWPGLGSSPSTPITPITPIIPSTQTSSGVAPGLYVQVIDGVIQVANSGANPIFTAGQFGYIPNFTVPPIVVPTNPGLQFTPPPIFSSTIPTTPSNSNNPTTIGTAIITTTTGSNTNNGNIDSKELKVKCDNLSCNLEVYAKTQFLTSTTGSVGTVTVHSGTSVDYQGSLPIDTLILGDANASGGATFNGSTNIKQVTVNGNGSAQTVLNLQGKIGTLEATGASQLVLTGSATIDNLIVPSGIDPKSLFANPADFSKVSSVNGQSTAPVTPPSSTVTTPPSDPNPPVDTTPPDGASAPTTAVQKIGSTKMATVTITDEDASVAGVVYYRVFVATGEGVATIADSYQQVNASGAADIDLDALTGGAIVPTDGQQVHFTVIAYDAAGNASVPSSNDMATVTWDKDGPTLEGSVTFVDTDSRANYFGGEIQVTRAINQSDPSPSQIAYYEIKITSGSSPDETSTDWSQMLAMDDSTILEATEYSETATWDVSGFQVSYLTYVQITAIPVDIYGNKGNTVHFYLTYG